MRKTKIICTLGPACDSDEMLKKMIEHGLDCARLNFSHGTHAEQKVRMDRVKRIREELGIPLPILLDTKGPEIRIRDFKNGKINNKEDKLDIFKKAYDTFLILLDIGIIKDLDYSRNYTTYILVYNKLKNDEPNKDNIYKYFAKNALIYKKYNFKDLYTLQEVLFKESFACTKEDFNKYIISEFEKEEN